MPEGPSVKRFQLLTAPFVGQVVAKVGGSSRQRNLKDLKAMRLQDSQASGKNLFLAFGASLEARTVGGSPSPIIQGKDDNGACSLSLAQEGQEEDVSQLSPKEHSVQRKQETERSVPDASDAAGDTWKWLRFHFGLFGSIRANEFSRANKANKRGDWKDPVPRLVLHFNSGGFLVFYNCQIHWCTSPAVEPASDILSPEFHRGQALAALRQPMPICYTLLDQRYFSGLELEDPVVGQDTELANSMGLFLQKTNIIRDYLEDQLEGREFWPREVWSRYAKKLSDLAKPEHIDMAVQCMNELITNALHHVPDVLTYLSRLKNQSVFNFCAIPQVMAIATLAACYNNKQVFRGVVKIRKGQAVTLMMDATNIQAVKAIMYQYVEEIYQKVPSTDPSSNKTQQIIVSIRTMSLPNGVEVSRNHYSPIYLSCAMLLAALSWQYLSAMSKASEEYVQASEN
ncbi:Squalene synthase [Chelonia mydas]|uniref:Squalene synthase n=1 Tax=Chelonia mydas TaxID=8469 RepID=M7BG56_CHEMY|nr:Squalene synthase [Chelonia mydas]